MSCQVNVCKLIPCWFICLDPLESEMMHLKGRKDSKRLTDVFPLKLLLPGPGPPPGLPGRFRAGQVHRPLRGEGLDRVAGRLLPQDHGQHPALLRPVRPGRPGGAAAGDGPPGVRPAEGTQLSGQTGEPRCRLSCCGDVMRVTRLSGSVFCGSFCFGNS